MVNTKAIIRLYAITDLRTEFPTILFNTISIRPHKAIHQTTTKKEINKILLINRDS